MQPHPDFADTDLPRSFEIGAYRLTPLSMAQTEEDFAVVTDSAPVLTEIFGDWPAGLTLEDNRVDLAWHDREFTARRSFSWIIRDEGDAYLGCFYVFPELGRRGYADAVIWLRRMDTRTEIATDLFPRLTDWAQNALPASVALSWTTSPQL